MPEARRKTLVAELMAARRAVATAKRLGDAEAERAARRRVHAAKVSLGERLSKDVAGRRLLSARGELKRFTRCSGG